MQGAGFSWWLEPSMLGAKRYALHAHCSFARLSEAEPAGAESMERQCCIVPYYHT